MTAWISARLGQLGQGQGGAGAGQDRRTGPSAGRVKVVETAKHQAVCPCEQLPSVKQARPQVGSAKQQWDLPASCCTPSQPRTQKTVMKLFNKCLPNQRLTLHLPHHCARDAAASKRLKPKSSSKELTSGIEPQLPGHKLLQWGASLYSRLNQWQFLVPLDVLHRPMIHGDRKVASLWG